jgi:hypothetical protein
MPSTPIQKKFQRLKQNYGIDQRWIDAQLEWQEYCCDGCKRPFNERVRYVVDHKHDTSIKVVRHLLCDSCNGALGTLEKLQKNEAVFKRLQLIAQRYMHYEDLYPQQSDVR